MGVIRANAMHFPDFPICLTIKFSLRLYMRKYDLTNCDLEPIHISGNVQSHGFLFVVDNDLNIAGCSENAGHVVGMPAETLLGGPIGALAFLENLFPANLRSGFRPDNPYSVSIGGKRYTLLVSAAEPYWLLEFEPELSNLTHPIELRMEHAMTEILAASPLTDLLQIATEHIRKIIQYDRVMVYKFHDDGHGEVVAESKTDELDTWQGLHYPASDIPQQARELYKVNLTRLIADVHAAPAALVMAAGAGGVCTVDLTNSTLRAVSPVHIQYLKNMKVASSFSVSILDNDKLWGLIACHNYTPRFINFRLRNAAKLVSQVLSTAVSLRQQDEDRRVADSLRTASEGILRHLSRNIPIQEALINEECTLLDAIPSSGAAIAYDKEIHTVGDVPDAPFLQAFVGWLARNLLSPVFHTDSLSAHFPEAMSQSHVASGVLACRLSSYHPEYLLWFRGEQLACVNWAGRPEKPAGMTENGLMTISPRQSFDVWRQDVHHTSAPWQTAEVQAAGKLTHEVKFAIGRKASEIRLLHDKLQEAYAELDTFSYTVSHDLKNPLTTIKSYSQLLNIRFGMDPKLKQVAERISESAQKMQLMIEEILNYSRMGQDQPVRRTVNMKRLLADLRDDFLVTQNNANLRIEVFDTPPLEGDEMMLLQIFSNLLGNAVKYSSKAPQAHIRVNGTIADTGITYAIEDNGIGISPADEHLIFNLFSRSREAEGFEGSGVGLAIVKRMVQKHQGRIWVESELGKGSTFFVHFPNPEIQRQGLAYA